jgi:hypothetical protein
MRDRYGDPIEDEPVDGYAVAHCPLCDDSGMRGLHRCDHIDYAEIARRHMPTIREVLKKGSK